MTLQQPRPVLDESVLTTHPEQVASADHEFGVVDRILQEVHGARFKRP